MRWWSREAARQLLAMPLGVLCALVPGELVVKMLAAWDFYAVGYLTLTWLAYRKLGPAEVRAMALGSRRRRLTDRLLVSPPEQVSQGAAVVALVATVIAMPNARELGAPPNLVVAICVFAVLSCWLTLQIGFAIACSSLYAEEGGLEFPGAEGDPAVVDFAYFAVAVGTTFGTTDVTVTGRRMRRQVLFHGVLAFFFNTLILAVAITIVTSYLAGA
ncbi:DUF1345 domain-containing protein [Kribbella sp. NPDC051770]|uniref:DUF1345 domain-containing protein n=1 Tax=Kribbella sp. NPDC051770 TaxID=3155413 RepID=UPI00341E6C89